VALLLNRELVSRVKLCLVSAFRDIVKVCPKFSLSSFENVGTSSWWMTGSLLHTRESTYLLTFI